MSREDLASDLDGVKASDMPGILLDSRAIIGALKQTAEHGRRVRCRKRVPLALYELLFLSAFSQMTFLVSIDRGIHTHAPTYMVNGDTGCVVCFCACASRRAINVM